MAKTGQTVMLRGMDRELWAAAREQAKREGMYLRAWIERSLRRELSSQFCACGKPLHYSDPIVRAAVEHLIADLGECIRVECGGRAWMVPRHYIALHGLKAEDLGTDRLPVFEQVT